MKHSLLSPSGASRWLECPPSARKEESFPSSTNDAADEGTLAHSLSQLYLENHLKLIKGVYFQSELKKIKHNRFYNAEMNEHCMNFTEFVLERMKPGSEIMIEESIDLSFLIEEGKGTADRVLIHDTILEIIDLKYGKGVMVEAKDNKQMMLYALGVLHKYRPTHNIKTVVMTIYQPRLDNFSSFEMHADDLVMWGEIIVRPTAELAFEGKGEFKPGKHCQFCKFRNECKALAKFHMDLAKYAFEDPDKLNDQDVAEILTKAPDFKVWLSSMQEYALNEAVVNQKQWPGFKLVAGRSNRIITDPLKIIKALKKAKFDESLYLSTPELLGIGKLETNIGKAEVLKYCNDWIIKPPGAATLVPDWDKRPALNSAEAAKQVFNNVDNN